MHRLGIAGDYFAPYRSQPDLERNAYHLLRSYIRGYSGAEELDRAAKNVATGMKVGKMMLSGTGGGTAGSSISRQDARGDDKALGHQKRQWVRRGRTDQSDHSGGRIARSAVGGVEPPEHKLGNPYAADTLHLAPCLEALWPYVDLVSKRALRPVCRCVTVCSRGNFLGSV